MGGQDYGNGEIADNQVLAPVSPPTGIPEPVEGFLGGCLDLQGYHARTRTRGDDCLVLLSAGGGEMHTIIDLLAYMV